MLNQEEQLNNQLEKAKNILITFSKDFNGDALASSLAMFLFLQKKGKKVEIVIENKDELKKYEFLPSINQVTNLLSNSKKFIISLNTSNAEIEKIKYKKEQKSLDFIISTKKGFFTNNDISNSLLFPYDLIITLDTPDLYSLGKIYEENTELFYKLPIINIGHKANVEEYGQINIIEMTSVATCEVLYNIFKKNNKDLISEEIATCLLAGIIDKTKSFKTQNITPQVLINSSELIEIGADREKIVNNLYRSKSLNILKLWGRILARLESDLNDSLIWSMISLSDFEKTNTSEKDLNEVIDELLVNIPKANIVTIFTEVKDEANATNVFIYSLKNINLTNLVKKWENETKQNFSKIKINKNITETKKEFIDYFKQKLEKIEELS